MKNRTLLLVIVAVVLPLFAQAQSDSARVAEDYRALYGRVYKSYVQEPENVANLLELSRFYTLEGNPMRNLCLAMKYVSQAEEIYVAMVDDKTKYKEVSRLIKKKVTVVSVREERQRVVEAMRTYLKNDRDYAEDELAAITEAFAAYPDVLMKVEHHRLNRIFQKAKEENTLEALYAFICKYPGTYEAEECAVDMGKLATKIFATLDTEKSVDVMARPFLVVESVNRAAVQRKASIAFAEACAINTMEGYRSFLSRYPSAMEYLDVLDMMDGLAAAEYSRLSSSEELAEFALANPGTDLGARALEQIRQRIWEEHDVPTTKLYLKLFPLDSSYIDVYQMYYGWVSAEGNRNPIQRFKEENPDFPLPVAIEEDLYQASRIDSIDLLKPFDESDFRASATRVYKLTGKDVSFVGLQRAIQRLVANKEWNLVLERMEFFDLCFEDWATDKYKDLIQLVKAPTDKRKTATASCAPSYDMIHPQVGPDGRLYYSRKEGNKVSIYVADKDDNDIWRSAGALTFTNADNQMMWFYGLFAGGSKMLVGQKGDIHIAVKDGKKWTLKPILDTTVNSRYYDGDGFMMPDGSGMLLCSDRPGGHNFQVSGAYFHGDTARATDLYFVPFDGETWGRAINLGIGVNTSCCERCPILSRDMKTLYFVSDGHVGFGYGDIFTAQREDIDDWTHWTSVTNYGKEVNTGYDESTVCLSADDKTLYFSTNQRGRYAFYSVAATHENHGGFKDVSLSVKGEKADLYVYDLATQKLVCRYEGATEDPKTFALYSEKEYLVQVRNTKNYVPSVLVTPQNNRLVEVHTDTKNDTIDLLSIRFESQKATLTTLSKQEIELFAGWVKTCPDVNLNVNVDVDGEDDEWCYQMSKERGNEIRKQLINCGLSDNAVSVTCYGNMRVKREGNGCGVQVIVSK